MNPVGAPGVKQMKAEVYRISTGWVWRHQGCDAPGDDNLGVPPTPHPVGWTWWGDIRPTQPDAFKRAERHMEKEHGIGTRPAGHDH